MNTKTLTQLSLAALLCGCPQLPPQDREVRVSPTIRVLRGGAVTHVPNTMISPTHLNAAGKMPGRADGDGWLFTVPSGPALFQFGLTDFVYSAGEVLRPCVEGFEEKNYFLATDGGVTFDLTFAAPAKARDLIHVRGALQPWFAPDAGSLQLQSSRRLIVQRGGPVTLSYLEWEDAGAGIAEHAIAVADAGVLDETNPVIRATFTPLQAGTPLSLDWNADALLANVADAGIRVPNAMELYVLDGDTRLARLYRQGPGRETLTLTPPALTPTHFEVWTNSIRISLVGETTGNEFSFAVPWTGDVSLTPPGGPARDLEILDRVTIKWTAPSPAPGAYVLTFLDASDPNTYGTNLGRMFTDQTEVPIPAEFRVSVLLVDVQAVSGGGISAAGCPLDYRLKGAPWSQFVSRSR